MRLCVFLVACTPIVPFHLAETAETLKKGGVSLTVAGGGGGGRDIHGCCGGGAVRAGGGAVRLSGGVGRQVELGFETAVIGGDPSTADGLNPHPHVFLLNKFRLKVGFGQYVALLAGLGLSAVIDAEKNTGYPGFGTDIGLVWSTGLMGRVLRIYGGARFSFVVPLRRDMSGGHAATTEVFTVPLGLSFAVTHPVRLYLEGGLVSGFSQGLGGDVFETWYWIGGYGLLAFSYAWNS